MPDVAKPTSPFLKKGSRQPSCPGAGEESGSFLKKRTKKLLFSGLYARSTSRQADWAQNAKVFCFFFSKKKALSVLPGFTRLPWEGSAAAGHGFSRSRGTGCAVLRKRLVFSVFLSTLLVGLSGCKPDDKAAQHGASPHPVWVVRAAAQKRDEAFDLPGHVQPRILIPLAFRVAGKVTLRDVQIGDRVKAGQVLAQLEPTDLRLSRQEADAAVAAAAADFANLRKQLSRYAGLGAQSPAFLPEELDRRQAALRIAQARLYQAIRQRDRAEDALGYTTLTADRDGVLVSLALEAGQVVAAGQTVMTMAAANDMEVEVDIPEDRLPTLRAAHAVAIRSWAAPDREIVGRIREIGSLADSETRTYAVKISLVAPPPDLALGMTATVRFVPASSRTQIVVPATALVKQNGLPAVWVLDPARAQAAMRRITVGAWRDDGTMSVLSGLDDGDLVIAGGANEIDAQMKLAAWHGTFR